MLVIFYFIKQQCAYEMRISDWSSDVCSSDLAADDRRPAAGRDRQAAQCGGLQGPPQSPLLGLIPIRAESCVMSVPAARRRFSISKAPFSPALLPTAEIGRAHV